MNIKLKFKITLSLLILLSATVFHDCYAKEPENLDFVKKKLIAYHDSGEYQKEINTAMNQALVYLQHRIKQPNHEKLAIVLDIDETSLSNYPDMVKFNFGGTAAENNKAVDEGHDKPIPMTLKLYHLAKSNHVAVFFITGRRESDRKGTVHNLLAVGYKNWNGLTLKPQDYANKSAAPYKIAARKRVEESGYKIILNIGDQKSDLMGGHAEKTIKLPNPYYFIA